MPRLLLLLIVPFFSVNLLNAQFSKGDLLLDGGLSMSTLDRRLENPPFGFKEHGNTIGIDLVYGRFFSNHFLLGLNLRNNFSLRTLDNSFAPFPVPITFQREMEVGAGVLSRYYIHRPGIDFFGQIRIGHERYTYRQGEQDELDLIYKYTLNLAELGLGLNCRLGEGLYLQVSTEHPVWNDLIWERPAPPDYAPIVNWHLDAKLEVIIDPKLSASRDAPLFQKGDFTIASGLRALPRSRSFNLQLEAGYLVDRHLMLGLQSPMEWHFSPDRQYYVVGIGPLVRWYLAANGRIGFFPEIRGSVEKRQGFGDNADHTLGLTAYSVNPGAGVSLFLQKRLALEWVVGQEFRWLKPEFGETAGPQDRKALRFRAGLRYFVEKQ